MTNLVDQLRENISGDHDTSPSLASAAADELERLQRELSEANRLVRMLRWRNDLLTARTAFLASYSGAPDS